MLVWISDAHFEKEAYNQQQHLTANSCSSASQVVPKVGLLIDLVHLKIITSFSDIATIAEVCCRVATNAYPTLPRISSSTAFCLTKI